MSSFFHLLQGRKAFLKVKAERRVQGFRWTASRHNQPLEVLLEIRLMCPAVGECTAIGEVEMYIMDVNRCQQKGSGKMYLVN